MFDYCEKIEENLKDFTHLLEKPDFKMKSNSSEEEKIDEINTKQCFLIFLFKKQLIISEHFKRNFTQI